MRARWGINSRRSSSRFAVTSALKTLIPVMLPPGRERLVTRPSRTGSSPTMKTMGVVVVAALAAKVDGVPAVAIQIGRQLRQPVVLIIGESIHNRHALAFHVAGVFEALAKSAQPIRDRVRESRVEKPDHRH